MSRGSWVEYSAETDFPVENLPYGVFHSAKEASSTARVGVAIGAYILDLAYVQKAGHFGDAVADAHCFSQVRPLSFVAFSEKTQIHL